MAITSEYSLEDARRELSALVVTQAAFPNVYRENLGIARAVSLISRAQDRLATRELWQILKQVVSTNLCASLRAIPLPIFGLKRVIVALDDIDEPLIYTNPDNIATRAVSMIQKMRHAERLSSLLIRVFYCALCRTYATASAQGEVSEIRPYLSLWHSTETTQGICQNCKPRFTLLCQGCGGAISLVSSRTLFTHILGSHYCGNCLQQKMLHLTEPPQLSKTILRAVQRNTAVFTEEV